MEQILIKVSVGIPCPRPQELQRKATALFFFSQPHALHTATELVAMGHIYFPSQESN